MVRHPSSCASQEPLINFYDLLTPRGGGLLGDLERVCSRPWALPAVQCNHEIADIVEPSSREATLTLEHQDNNCAASRPLHVLVFCEKWESGGVEAFVTTLLECMDRTGLTVDLAACKVQPGPYDARLAEMGVEPIALGASIRDVAANLKAFRRLLEQGDYDAVHLNVYEGLALLFAREAKKAGVARVIVHSHNNDLRPSATRWLKLALHRVCTGLLGGYADVRWAPSQAAGRFMFGERPFALVRNGIVPERFAFDAGVRGTLRSELGFAPGQTVLGCVGRLCEQKNQLFLVDVLVALPKNACLLLVGEDDGDGSHEAALRRRACELGVQDRVHLYGRTSDVAPLYQAMDVLCVPSTFEALGIVAVEGQAAGLPVVASTAVPPEAHAGGALSRIPLDTTQWVAALAAAPIDLATRAEGAVRVAEAGYDMRTIASEVLGAYGNGELIGASRSLTSFSSGAGEVSCDTSGLVSVIVPVYNVADYVADCLESLRCQTHGNIEVIVVDDGSVDGSGEVCDRFAAIDARFRVIHQSNKGLSSARNAGLDAARGEYISFVDSDDAISPVFIEALLALRADVAQCTFVTEADGLACCSEIHGGPIAMTGREACHAQLLDSTGNATVVWNKLYKASLFNDIRFPADKQHEDEFVTHRVLWNAASFSSVTQPLYFYRQRSNSIMGSGFNAGTQDAFEALEQRASFYRLQEDEELAALCEAVLCNRIGTALDGVATYDPDGASGWSAKRDSLLKSLLASPYIGVKKKLSLLLQRAMPEVFARIKGR